MLACLPQVCFSHPLLSLFDYLSSLAKPSQCMFDKVVAKAFDLIPYRHELYGNNT